MFFGVKSSLKWLCHHDVVSLLKAIHLCCAILLNLYCSGNMELFALEDLISTKSLNLLFVKFMEIECDILSESGYVVITGQSHCCVDSLSFILTGLGFTTGEPKAPIFYEVFEALGPGDGCIVSCLHYDMPGGRKLQVPFPLV